MSRLLSWICLAFGVTGVVVADAGWASAAELKVVVTSKPIHSLVAGVMGGVGSPRLLVDGTASPHTYAMKPSDAQAANAAAVLFRVSEGLEPFTAKLAKALPRSVQLVTLEDAAGVRHLERRHGGSFEAHSPAAKSKSHHHGHGHNHGAETDTHDSHVWLDPDNARAMVDHIASVLSAKAPEHTATFKTNAQAVSQSIAALSAEIETALTPIAAKPFVVFHDAYQYLEKRYGLTAVGSITVSPDVQPSAKRLAELRRKITALGAICVFAEPNFEPKVVNTVIEGTQARTGTLDPEGAALTPGPGLYATLMRNLAKGLKVCLGGVS